jgi:hypothetical protein
MTRLQLDVYKGRSMGCMGCGRSFPVVAPPPRPRPGTAGNTADAGRADRTRRAAGGCRTPGTAPADPRVGRNAFGSAAPGPTDPYGPGPANPYEANPYEPPNPYATPPAQASAAPPAPRRPAAPPPLVAHLGVAAAVLFAALAAAAAVVGYAGSADAAIRTAAQTRAPLWLLSAATASAAAAVALGLAGLWLVRRQTP